MTMSSESLVARSARSNSIGQQLERVFGRDFRVAWLFFLPTALLLGGLIAYPVFNAVYLSLHVAVGPTVGRFVGLDNYIDLWDDPMFRESVFLTARFTFFSVFFKFWLGLAAAVMLHQRIKFRNVLTALVLLPWIVPEVVTALAWRGIFDPVFGGLNNALLTLGLVDKGIAWLGTPELALPAVTAVNVWKGIPFFAVTLLAGMKSIDSEQYDAAAVDGASAWRRFIHITLPGLRYVIIVCTLLSTIWTFNNFGIIYLLTGGGPGGSTRVYTILAYEALAGLRYSFSVTVALAMAPFLGVIIFVLGRYMMTNNQRVDEGGLASTIVSAITWPVRMVGTVLGFVFGVVNNAVEDVLSGMSRVLSRGQPGGAFSQRTSKRASRAALYACLSALVAFELFPFYWVIITAFKTGDQIRTFRSIFWPEPFSLDNFVYMLQERPFMLWMQNTFSVALVATFIAILASSLGAYAIVRMRWRGQGPISTIILIAYLIPGVLLIVPLFQILVWLKLVNSLGALMITYPTFTLPFATWMLMGYYRAIPEELEEAALIDGCNRFQAFFRIILPLIRPALLAVALFAVTGAFNEFLMAFVFTTSEQYMTVGVGMAKMVIGDIFPFGPMSAGAIMMAIPVIILYTFAQRVMVEGLTAGSVKG
ncbi:MAG: ABC transporter permease subunit [Chloroflexota bacterium]|nr:MAG: ABC transporter permease subunit [Chloroflexota bacterium]